MDSLSTHPATNRAGRLMAAAVAIAVSLSGVVLAPAANAVAPIITATVPVDTDDTGEVVMTWEAPEGAQINHPRFATFTVEGNRSAGAPAWIELSKVANYETGEQVLAARVDLIMTAAPQVVQIPVDTSTLGGYLYFVKYAGADASGSGGFSYQVWQDPVVVGANIFGDPNADPSDEDETHAKSAVTLATSATKVRVGAKVRLAGKITGTKTAGLRIIALAKTGKGWSKVGSTTTARSGRYKLRTRGLASGVRKLKVSVPALSISATRTIRVHR